MRHARFLSIVLAVLTAAATAAGQADVKTVKRAEDLPEPFAREWRPGDTVVSSGGVLALFGGVSRPLMNYILTPSGDARGCLLAVAPAGHGVVNDVAVGNPVLKVEGRRELPVYSEAAPVPRSADGSGPGIAARASFPPKGPERLRIRTEYRFAADGRIDVLSSVENTGAEPLRELEYSLAFDVRHVYRFSPFSPEDHPGLDFRVVPKKGFCMGWIRHVPAGVSADPGPRDLAPGGKFEVRYSLFVETDMARLLERIYGLLGVPFARKTFRFEGFTGPLMEVVVRNAVTEAVFFRNFLAGSPDPFSFVCPLPEGTYRIVVNAFPAVIEKTFAVVNGDAAGAAAIGGAAGMGVSGTGAVAGAGASKTTDIGTSASASGASTAGGSALKTTAGQSAAGAAAKDGASGNVAGAGVSETGTAANASAIGQDADEPLVLQDVPKGSVHVAIRDASGAAVPGKVTFIGLDPTKSPYFAPENPVETGRGWETARNAVYPPEGGETAIVPAGTYLLTASRGPEYGVEHKVVEVLGGGRLDAVFRIDRVVEAPGFVSLDPHLHTNLTDGRPNVPERLRSVVAEGLDAAVAADHNIVVDYAGPLKSLGLEKFLAVIPGEEITPGDGYVHSNLFPVPVDAEAPGRGALSAPFRTDSLRDLLAAARKKAPGAVLQLNHPRSEVLGLFNNAGLDKESAEEADPNFDLSFDVVEVMNGPRINGNNRQAIEDWLHLLNRGYGFAASGSSDSHGTVGSEPGYSRTYVPYAGGKAESLDAKAVAAAFKDGGGFVTNGPLVAFKVNGCAPSRTPLAVPDGRVTVSVKVSAAPWVDVSEVRIVVNGERRHVIPAKAGAESTVRFADEVALTLDRDAYIAVEVLGRATLFPVVQQRSRDGSIENAALPYALTNPVYVDVDGNGRFDPLWEGKVKARGAAVPSR